jgi:hypothetical protein
MPEPIVERDLKSESLYFRVTTDLRDAVNEFAAKRGLTLSSATAILVEFGLEAMANEVSIKDLEVRLAVSASELAARRLQLAEAQGEVEKWRAVFRGIEGYLRNLTVGRCPACRQPVTAYDQAVARLCPNPACDGQLAQVEQTPEFNPLAVGFLGAIGGLIVGLAAAGQAPEGPK